MIKRNRFSNDVKNMPFSRIRAFVAPIILFGLLISFLTVGTNNVAQANQGEALRATIRAVTRATVQFYALEGRYPPTLEYLIDRFNLQLDEYRFIIHYNVLGSNIMPQITVLPRYF